MTVLAEIIEKCAADLRRAHETRCAQGSVIQVEISAKGGADMIRRKAPILQKSRLTALFRPRCGGLGPEPAAASRTRARGPIGTRADRGVDEPGRQAAQAQIRRNTNRPLPALGMVRSIVV